MKLLSCLFLFVSLAQAQNLSPEEQKRLLDENKFLKEELMKAKTNPAPEQSNQMMQALQKGKKFQEDQNKALEELDQEP